MRLLMKILGYLTGKTAVTCVSCRNLTAGNCYGKIPIPPADQTMRRVCGFHGARLSQQQ